MRSLAFFLFLTAPAFADEGLHHHPHGVEFGWLVAAVAGVVGGLALSRFWGRK